VTVPNFLVAGAARSGTTGLVEGLRTHPRVFLTSPKEPHYFALHGTRPNFRGPGDAATINRVAVTDLAQYLSLYPAEDRFLALGDGSVSTLYYADRATSEVLRINPAMRVVVILREPVSRAYSSFMYMRARGFEPCADFLDALAEEETRRDDHWHHLWHYTAMSKYAQSLRLLREGLGADRVGVWFYDDLETDYQDTVGQVLRFLQVPPHPTEGAGVPRVNVSGTPRLAPLQRGVVWATRNDVLRRTVKHLTTFRFREFVRRTNLRPGSVPAAVEQALAGYFDADLREVCSLLDGPLPEWLSRHHIDLPAQSERLD